MLTTLLRAGALAVALTVALPTAHPAFAQAPAGAMPAGSSVMIDNFVFGPATITVPVGTTVTWINHDDAPHTVVANDGSFKSKVLDTDERFSFTFATVGDYSYFCSLHPHMTGKVVVEAKAN
jgi:plastocyanin